MIHIEADPLWAAAVKSATESCPSLVYQGVVTSSVGALAQIHTHHADVILIELNLPDGEGFHLIQLLTALKPAPRILLTTANETEAAIYLAMQPQIHGMICKTEPDRFASLLRTGLEKVLQGGIYRAPEVEAAIRRLRRSPDAFFKILSPAELSLLPCFATGDADCEIAARTGLATGTVKGHRNHVLKKLGLNTSTKLIRWAVDKGFCQVQPARMITTVRDF